MDTGMAFDPAIAGAGLAADEMDVDAPAPDLSDGNKFCQDRSNPAHPVALDGTDVPCGPGGKDSWALCNVCKAKNVCQRCNEENSLLDANPTMPDWQYCPPGLEDTNPLSFWYWPMNTCYCRSTIGLGQWGPLRDPPCRPTGSGANTTISCHGIGNLPPTSIEYLEKIPEKAGQDMPLPIACFDCRATTWAERLRWRNQTDRWLRTHVRWDDGDTYECSERTLQRRAFWGTWRGCPCGNDVFPQSPVEVLFCMGCHGYEHRVFFLDSKLMSGEHRPEKHRRDRSKAAKAANDAIAAAGLGPPPKTLIVPRPFNETAKH
ncbi:hypothetical protein MBLNU230_g2162t1 [Neophaeotheca triangularis]